MIDSRPTPLIKKLGLKRGNQVYLYNPCSALLEAIKTYDVTVLEQYEKEIDYVQIFSNNLEELQRELIKARNHIKQSGMIWASWYKKSSKLQKEVNEDQIRACAFPLDLVDVKVCAIDTNWSALKLVIRKEYRI